jgi:putative addiction module component (TIGR02574 family)
MDMNVEELESEVLKLDAESRARLAQTLLVSLGEPLDEELAQAWAAEAERRNAEMDADPESGRPAEDVFRDAYARLK